MNKNRKYNFKKTGSKKELNDLIENCKGREKDGFCRFLYAPCKTVIDVKDCPVIKAYVETHTIGDIGDEDCN